MKNTSYVRLGVVYAFLKKIYKNNNFDKLWKLTITNWLNKWLPNYYPNATICIVLIIA